MNHLPSRIPAFLFLLLLLSMGCSTTSTLNQSDTGGSAASLDLVGHYLNGDSPDDSGMWLLPQIEGAVHAEMASKGLRLTPDQIYNAGSPSLNQAIVRINIGQGGGGTGSFVSPKGLVLTNHHVAYDAIAAASTADVNYLNQGFYAEAMADESPVDNYYLYIPIEQREVTSEINARLSDTLTVQERSQMEQQVRQQLIQERKAGDNDLVVEIDDYWAGNRQYMAVYQVIRNVRLVYAPPSSIGKYGGDIDNWEWPRHTGDYAFLRGYVAPDGEARSYHEENVPYSPDTHLPVSAEGVDPNDFTMTLGFPGTTYRYQSSYAFEYYYNVQNPVTIKSYQAILDAMELAAKEDPDVDVATASDRASYANALKYYQGVQSGFEEYGVIDRKKRQERAFSRWVQNDPDRKDRYGNVLQQLDRAFDIASQHGDLLYSTYYTLNNSSLMQLGGLYMPYQEALQQPDSLDWSEGRRDTLVMQHRQMLESMNMRAQKQMLDELIEVLATLPETKQPLYIFTRFSGASGEELEDQIATFVNDSLSQSIIFDPDAAEAFLDLPPQEAADRPLDPMLELYSNVIESFRFSRQQYFQHNQYLGPAREGYVSGMLDFRNDSTEYPDANFTLRLSGGRVLGYNPRDGVYNIPFTTLAGMIAKDTDEDPFDAPQALEDYFHRADTSGGSFAIPYADRSGRLIANLLTTNDITGGNSGSPLLNGSGEIVGIAFDSNFKGVVGDYYYDPNYNRTINVDIRYVLFLMSEFSKADRILDEMSIVGER